MKIKTNIMLPHIYIIKNRMLHFKYLLGCFLFLVSFYAQAGLTFDRIIIFGDSLSDTGKMYQKSKGWLPSSPPYHEGRFSDGPIWVDYLKEKLQKKYTHQVTVINEAEGGATAAAYEKESWNPTYQVINNLDFEFNQYSKDYQFKPNDLVVIWAGANDYMTNGWRDSDTVMLAIDQLITKVLLAGANNVLVFNLPLLSTTPFAIHYEPEKLNELKEITEEHNNKLRRLIKTRNYKHVRLYDIAYEFSNIMKTPTYYGFHHIDQACYKKGYIWRPFLNEYYQPQQMVAKEVTFSAENNQTRSLDEMSAKEVYQLLMNSPLANNPMMQDALPSQQVYYSQDRRVEQDLELAGDKPESCEGYLFWDKVHPTSAAHKILADKIFKFLQQRYVNYNSSY
ncbi:SGNH/GDSL hydrolase family protein [Zooshikella sp. RANM57]|uniref:SGNH/GDSL hydrolase family protein n=1 Tax=Zooshikella sp. RANM57 TaxID=3425863 RepID=UPI003D6FD78E